ncbi:conserved hypothetical protein [Ricinus communis]|uniref:Reverse transcriptase zinc-binding domain-containing protein n=1 Tax=Ricinus communis TaxID=3988 RepID=B9RYT8_RICCO|nr:conserved hypothetical protein [Ricinus communis]
MKLGWNLVSNNSTLWVQVLKGKYLKGDKPTCQLKAKPNYFSTWRSICLVWDSVCKGTSHSIDSWVEGVGILKDVAIRPIPDHLKDNKRANIVWDRIWKWQGPQKVHSTLWLLAHDKLSTNKLCSQRAIIPLAICMHCNQSEEDSLHAIRDCPFAKIIWQKLVKPDNQNGFFTLDTHSWLSKYLSQKDPVGKLCLEFSLWHDCVAHIDLEK